MTELILYSEMSRDYWETHVEEDEHPERPHGYTEVHTSTATICIGNGAEAIITFTDVGATRMYMVALGPAFGARDWSRGPYHSSDVYVYEFYSRALQEARAACGWDWEPHPDNEQHEGYVTTFNPATGRQITIDTHPSLTAGERNA
jgi:hypothetical protein